MDKSLAHTLYKNLVRIRRFEEEVEKLFAAGELPGFVHLYIGQEANAVGVCANLNSDDYITSTHRGHGHCIAKGGELSRMMAELMAKKTGYNKGKGGSMHLACTEIGILGANGVNAAGLPLAVGAALSSKMLKNGRVAVAFFGDGASNQGTFHEAVNLATAFKLPVLFACENNQYGVGTRITEVTGQPDISRRSITYNIPGVIVDGQNVVKVYEAAKELLANIRGGQGPAILEMKTWRYRGHFQGEPATYRDPAEEKRWLENDPLPVARREFGQRGLMTEAEFATIERQVAEEVAAAVAYGHQSPFPEPADALTDVYA